MSMNIMRQVLLCGMVMAAPPLCEQAKAANHYDAVKQFRLKSNPNGVWTYMDTDPLPYSHHAYERVKGLENWSDDGREDETASIILNTTGSNVLVDNGATLIPTGYLALDAEGAPTGADLRFTAPAAGTYIAKFRLVALNTPEKQGTVVYVYHNGATIWRGRVTDRAHRHAKLPVVMAAGDTLDFLNHSNGKPGLNYVGLALTMTGP